jgi:hypothetical protein
MSTIKKKRAKEGRGEQSRTEQTRRRGETGTLACSFLVPLKSSRVELVLGKEGMKGGRGLVGEVCGGECEGQTARMEWTRLRRHC